MRTLTAAILLAVFCSSAPAQKHGKVPAPGDKVGIATRVFHPAVQRNWRGAETKELRVTVWYPAVDTAVETPQLVGPPDAPLFAAGSAAANAPLVPALKQLPLIVLSHGSGGSAQMMAWLGTALARNGFIAAAVDHPGNNSREPYTAEGFELYWERATDLSEVIDGMLADPEFGAAIDTRAIGAAGFSIGGYTVLAIAGARTDVSVLMAQCHQTPTPTMCHTPEMNDMGSFDEMTARVRKSSGESLARSADSFADARVRAVFAIAPAVGMTLTPESLHSIRVPVELVSGDSDTIVPVKTNVDVVRANTHGAREEVLPGGVGHYTFLDTCLSAGKQQLPQYCTDSPGVDRDAVHAQVSAMAVQFFAKALKLK